MMMTEKRVASDYKGRKKENHKPELFHDSLSLFAFFDLLPSLSFLISLWFEVPLGVGLLYSEIDAT